MNRRHALSLAAMALGIAGIITPATRAEYLQYTTAVAIDSTTGPLSSVTTGTTPINQGGYAQNAPFAAITSAGGNQVQVIGLASNPASNNINAQGPLGTDIVPVDFHVTAPGGSPTEAVDFTYTATLTIKDYATATSTTPIGTGSIQVTERIFGTIGNGQTTLNELSFAFTPSSGVVTIGPESYTFTSNGYTAPGVGGNDGSLGLHVVAVPEPASMALIGLGGLGALRVFRRKKSA